MAVGREKPCKQISLASVGHAHSVSAALGLPLLRACVLSESTLLRLQVALPGAVWGGPRVARTPQVWAARVQALRSATKAPTWLACVLCPSQVRAAQVTRCLVSAGAPSWRLRLIASPVTAARFSGCTTGAPSQVFRVSLLGSWSLAATLLADVNRPESQGVLVSNEVCLQFGIGCLSGAAIAPFRLRLPLPACLRCGMARSAAG